MANPAPTANRQFRSHDGEASQSHEVGADEHRGDRSSIEKPHSVVGEEISGLAV
jgi:hypothetical protein